MNIYNKPNTKMSILENIRFRIPIFTFVLIGNKSLVIGTTFKISKIMKVKLQIF